MSEKKLSVDLSENSKRFTSIITDLLNVKLLYEKDNVQFKIEILFKSQRGKCHSKEINFKFDYDYINNLFNKLDSFNVIEDGLILLGENSFEKLVKFEKRFKTFRKIEGETYEINDDKNQIHYNLGNITNTMLLSLLLKIHQLKKLKDLKLFRHLRYFDRYIDEDIDEVKNEFLLNVLCEVFNQYYDLSSIYINVQKSTSLEKYIQFETSYRYSLSFYKNEHVIPLIDFSNVTYRYFSEAKPRTPKMNPPKRTYDPNIIYYYQMAISSENPVLQFISLYHVMEYFFDHVYNEKIIAFLKSRITNPNFDFSDDLNYMELVEELVKGYKLGTKKKTIEAPDKQGLIDTLRKYVPDHKVIVKQIKKLNADLISHYKDNEVSFSKGSKVNLNSKTEFYENIVDRIYSTRNAIFHSSMTDSLSFKPFRDEEELA